MLTYGDTSEPGITRRKRGKHWHYFMPDCIRITAPDEIARLNKLAVPPAYQRVWYSPDPDSHLQAIGYDDRGRRQYRYHPDFRRAQDGQKYDRCVEFGSSLPLVRARVEADMKLSGLPRDKVLAAVVRLLDQGHVRVGNEAYATENKSFGATTLRNRHGAVRGDTVKLDYRGKSGKQQQVSITDKALAKIVRRCQDLPGQALFQYVADDGTPHRIGSAEVNSYIKAAMGDDFSAKHFRTWGASVIAFETLIRTRAPLTLKAVLEPVAEALGNTPAISRKSYVHPKLLKLVTEGHAFELAGTKLPRSTQWLTGVERGLIGLLET
ncbi:DNA topoisomerase IB [Sphingosinicellaceae bacterium]|nr:DNA topoisomerase IB [Sphingosinicellaceae bacterium]